MMRVRVLMLAAGLVTAPPDAQAADLVVSWDEGYYIEEREAIKETVAAFEQETGKQVELVFHSEREHPKAVAVAWEGGQPPDLAFGLLFSASIGQWPSMIGSSTFRTPSAPFRTFLTPIRLPG
jgi:ABC-type glycerol-3-phosphate transport system substrate-binding protein